MGDGEGLLLLNRLAPVLRHHPGEAVQLGFEIDEPVGCVGHQFGPPLPDVLIPDRAVHRVRVQHCVDLRKVLIQEEPQRAGQVERKLRRPQAEPPFKFRRVLHVLCGEARVKPHDVRWPQRPLVAQRPERDGGHSSVPHDRFAG